MTKKGHVDIYSVQEIDFIHGTLGRMQKIISIGHNIEQESIMFGVKGIFVRTRGEVLYVLPSTIKKTGEYTRFSLLHYMRFFSPRYIGYHHILLKGKINHDDVKESNDLDFKVGNKTYHFPSIKYGDFEYILCEGEIVYSARQISHLIYIDKKLFAFVAEQSNGSYVVVFDGKRKREYPLKKGQKIIPCFEIKFLEGRGK